MLDVPFFARLITCVLDGSPFRHVERAVPLLLGVAATETGLENIRQVGGGPARGIFQLEPVTARDLHTWLMRDAPFTYVVVERCGVKRFSLEALEQSLLYQIVLARTLFYVRDPQPLPEPQDIAEMARRYKVYYNTADGKGSEAKYRADYARLIGPHYQPLRRSRRR